MIILELKSNKLKFIYLIIRLESKEIMPGIDKSKFVNVPEADLDEYTCIICMDVLNDPVCSPCCSQCYCRDCITEWLTTRNICPNDRKQLSITQLIATPRGFNNLLNRLLIKCDFNGFGCLTTPKLEELSTHLAVCDYNPNRLCADCGLKVGSDHNCISNLKVKNESISDEMNRLINENQNLREVNQNLLAENQNLMQEINELKDNMRVTIRLNSLIKYFKIIII